MRFFYSNDIVGSKVHFSAEECQHLLKSMRVREGDTLHVLDGQGKTYTCMASDVSKRRVEAIIQSTQQHERDDCLLTIAIAPTKNAGRFETFVEKATELGVHAIIPLLSSRSEKPKIKQERLLRIAVSAIKQSGNPFLPEISELQSFEDLVKMDNHFEQKFIAHCNSADLPWLKNHMKTEGHQLVMIGPEGDFTLDEVQLAKRCGYKEISLGKRRLRTETAGIVVSTLYSLIN